MALTRLIGWLIAALFGGGAAILINQYFIQGEPVVSEMPATHTSEDSAEDEDVPPPPPLTRPDDARRVIIATLSNLGLSSQSIRQGYYPLRGSGRNPSDVMPLISFECPLDTQCESVMAALQRALSAAGMDLTRPSVPDRVGRPVFRAVFQDGRPAVALRAYPPGGRITVVIENVGSDASVLDALYELDPDVTYAVLANTPQAPEVSERLRELGREFIAHLPMRTVSETEAKGAPALDVGMTPGEIAEYTQTYIDVVGGAAGVDSQYDKRFSASSTHMSAVFEVLADNGRYFFDQRPSDASVATALAKALGVRTVSRTHRIEASGSIDAQLQAVRVALVLEGEAVVVVQPNPDVIEALKPWLAELRKRKFNVMRLSEIVL